MTEKCRMVWITASCNFRRWKGNMRIAAAFGLAFILCFLLTDKTIQFAEECGSTMQVTEAFIWSFGDSNSILLMSLLLLLLFADMPFITPATPFFLSRCSRKIWVAGQLLYIIMATFFYLLFVLFSTCVLCFRYAYPANIWSRTAANLAYSEAGQELALPATAKIVEMSRPWQVTLWIFGLLLLYALVMVFLMLFCNLKKGPVAGVIGALMFSVYGALLNPENISVLFHLPDELYYKARVWAGWLSPLNHATFSMHDFGYDLLPTLQQTGLIFAGIFLALIFFVIRALKRYSFEFRGTRT